MSHVKSEVPYPWLDVMDAIQKFVVLFPLALTDLLEPLETLPDLLRQLLERCVTAHDAAAQVRQGGHVVDLQVLDGCVGAHGGIVTGSDWLLEVLRGQGQRSDLKQRSKIRLRQLFLF